MNPSYFRIQGSNSAATLQVLARDADLIVAGYNDAVPYGQLVLVSGGIVTREFLDDPAAPEENVDRGRSNYPFEPLKTWIDVAGFVDGDPLAVRDHGWLWIW